jgi:hypothetical protein
MPFLIFSALFNSPPAAAKVKKEFCGDTPHPGKGLRPLHSLLNTTKESSKRCLSTGKGFHPLHSSLNATKESSKRCLSTGKGLRPLHSC